MRTVREDTWMRRGVTLLWGAEALSKVGSPVEVVSVRQFFSLAKNWPEDLPSAKGQALIVAGMEACLDALTPQDAKSVLAEDFKQLILDFQAEYEGQAALVLWLPSGRQRITMNHAAEKYLWHCGHPYGHEEIEIGRILWAGAERDAAHILDAKETNQDPDGPAWIGLHQLRIS